MTYHKSRCYGLRQDFFIHVLPIKADLKYVTLGAGSFMATMV